MHYAIVYQKNICIMQDLNPVDDTFVVLAYH